LKTQLLVRPIRDYRVYCEPHTYEAAWALDSEVAATGRTRDEAIARCVELIRAHVVPEVVEVEVP
jgi:hypothetical protein